MSGVGTAALCSVVLRWLRRVTVVGVCNIYIARYIFACEVGCTCRTQFGLSEVYAAVAWEWYVAWSDGSHRKELGFNALSTTASLDPSRDSIGGRVIGS